MKKMIIALVMLPFFGNAQKLIGGSNVFKTNLSALALGNLNLTYERSIAKKLSLSISYATKSKGSMPFANTLQNLIDDPDVKVSDFQYGSTTITPELRLYLGTGKLKGFYLAPYVRFSTVDLSVPISYTPTGLPNKLTAVFDGKFKATSGGLLIGIQKHIAKKLVLDFWILGGHFGSSNGTIVANHLPPLSNLERDGLQTQLNETKEAGPFKFKGVAGNAQSVVTAEGAWAGIRAAGICLGIRF